MLPSTAPSLDRDLGYSDEVFQVRVSPPALVDGEHSCDYDDARQPRDTSAAKPTIGRFNVDETFSDEFLTEACGFDVVTRAQGHVAVRTFSGAAGPAGITTLSIAFTATAGDNTYRFRDVGADHVQVKKDGTTILLIIGQIPFGFPGVLKIDLGPDEAILEPHHSLEGRIEEACAALSA